MGRKESFVNVCSAPSWVDCSRSQPRRCQVVDARDRLLGLQIYCSSPGTDKARAPLEAKMPGHSLEGSVRGVSHPRHEPSLQVGRETGQERKLNTSRRQEDMTKQIIFILTLYLLLAAVVSWIALLALRAEDQDKARRAQISSKDGRHDGDSANPHVTSGSNAISGTAEI